MVNVGKDSIHGASGIVWIPCFPTNEKSQPASKEFGVLPLIESLAGIKHLVTVKEFPSKNGRGGGVVTLQSDVSEPSLTVFLVLGNVFHVFFQLDFYDVLLHSCETPSVEAPSLILFIFFRCYDFGFLTFIPGMNK